MPKNRYYQYWPDEYAEELVAERHPPTPRPPRYERTPARILEDVCDLIHTYGEVDASDVEVDFAEGVVTLRGTVPGRYEKRRLENLAYMVPGVHDVMNRLRIRSAEEAARRPAPWHPAEQGRRS